MQLELITNLAVSRTKNLRNHLPDFSNYRLCHIVNL